jgi:hypothetical protein
MIGQSRSTRDGGTEDDCESELSCRLKETLRADSQTPRREKVGSRPHFGQLRSRTIRTEWPGTHEETRRIKNSLICLSPRLRVRDLSHSFPRSAWE